MQNSARASRSMFASVSNATRESNAPGKMLIMPSSNLVADLADDDLSENFKVHRIRGDGKCMFRATVRLLATP